MAQDELGATEQHSRLSMFHQNQGFHQSVQEHQRRARYEENQAAPDSLARILFKIGSETQAALRHQRAHMLTEQTQVVLEGGAQR